MACSVAVQPAGHGMPLQVEVLASGDAPVAVTVAKQQAALAMLHQLQALVVGLLKPAKQFFDAAPAGEVPKVSWTLSPNSKP